MSAAIPGPHRAVPPCRHFPTCGGCRLQQLDDAAYAGFLRERIAAALTAHGLDVPDMAPPHLSPPRTRRRAAMKAERRGGRVLLGFSEAASHRLVDLAECWVLDPRLFALVAPLRKLLGGMIRHGRGAGVRMTLADQGVDLLLEGVAAEGLAAAEALTAFADTHRLARLSIDEGHGPEARWEPAGVTVTLGGIAVPLPEGAFLQATTDGEAALAAAVGAATAGAGAIADLFAGLGTFALPLSSDAKLLAVEGARDAALALGLAARRAGRPVLVEQRDLFRRPLGQAELARFDAVVLDPPRAGAREQMPALAASGVPRIAYVSCNPATFARDAAVLAGGGYRLGHVMPVGQFRWSTHVELVAAFER